MIPPFWHRHDELVWELSALHKLAKSSSLERNLANQVDIYEAANKTKQSVAVVICYSAADQVKTNRVIKKLKLDEPDARPLVVIDARSDNKPSASKV